MLREHREQISNAILPFAFIITVAILILVAIFVGCRVRQVITQPQKDPEKVLTKGLFSGIVGTTIE